MRLAAETGDFPREDSSLVSGAAGSLSVDAIVEPAAAAHVSEPPADYTEMMTAAEAVLEQWARDAASAAAAREEAAGTGCRQGGDSDDS